MRFPVFVRLHRSRFLMALLLCVHGLAVAGLFSVHWPLAVQLFLLVLLGVSAVLSRRYLLSFPEALVLYQDGRLALGSGEGEPRQVELLPGVMVLPVLCVFRYRDQGRVSTLSLLPDSTDAESLRRLRVWLRWCVNIEDQP